MAATLAQASAGESTTILTDTFAIVPAGPAEMLILATPGDDSKISLAASKTVPTSASVDPNRGVLEADRPNVPVPACSPTLLGWLTCGAAASRMAVDDGGPGDVKELISRTPAPMPCGVRTSRSQTAETTFGGVNEWTSHVPTSDWSSDPQQLSALGPSGEATEGTVVGEHEVGTLPSAPSTVLSVDHISRTACDIASSCC